MKFSKHEFDSSSYQRHLWVRIVVWVKLRSKFGTLTSFDLITKLKSKPLKGLCSEPPTQTSDIYLNEVIGELERAYSLAFPINLFIKLPVLVGITASTYITEVYYVTLLHFIQVYFVRVSLCKVQ